MNKTQYFLIVQILRFVGIKFNYNPYTSGRRILSRKLTKMDRTRMQITYMPSIMHCSTPVEHDVLLRCTITKKSNNIISKQRIDEEMYSKWRNNN